MVVVRAFNPSPRECRGTGSLSSKPVWSTELVLGQPGLHRETLSWKKKEEGGEEGKKKMKEKIKYQVET